MMSKSTKSTHWLTLSQAATKLDVHPTTLRRWADQGDIAVVITPGGHRRFGVETIDAFTAGHESRARTSEIEKSWATQALQMTRQQVTTSPNPPWLIRLDEDARQKNRILGQQLLGLTLQYLSQQDEAILVEAKKMGHRYGYHAQAQGMPLAEALSAAIFFRDTLVETALQLPENSRIRPDTSLKLLRRINTILNIVHLAIAEVYDAPTTLPRN